MKETKERTMNKGITLVALIITIIVMLILVGVTVNFAFGDGIFKKTKDASQKTTKAVIEEQVLSLIVANFNVNQNRIDDMDELLANIQKIKGCEESFIDDPKRWITVNFNGNDIICINENGEYGTKDWKELCDEFIGVKLDDLFDLDDDTKPYLGNLDNVEYYDEDTSDLDNLGENPSQDELENVVIYMWIKYNNNIYKISVGFEITGLDKCKTVKLDNSHIKQQNNSEVV